jgi:two-component system, sporulation sensor kinase E
MSGVGSYSISLVLLSIFIGVISAYAALDMICRSSSGTLCRKRPWLVYASILLGIGIWSMHFTGMLAYHPHFELKYDVGMTIISLLVAVMASFLAMHLIRKLNTYLYVLASFVMGSGISIMHYTGMAAVRSPYEIRYALLPFLLSIGVAVFISFLALYYYYQIQRSYKHLSIYKKVIISMIWGTAISGMHYTGMYATHFVHYEEGEEPSQADHGISTFMEITMNASVLALWVSLSVACIVGVMCFGVFINKRITVEIVADNEVRFRSIFERSPDLVCALDNKGRFHSANHATLLLWGYSEEELRNQSFKTLIIAEDEKRFSEAFEQVLLGNAKEFNVHVRHKEGRLLELQVTLTPICFRNRLIYIYAIIKDLTELKKHQELKRRSERLDVAGQLAASIAHEMRNPLTSVKGLLQLLREGKGKEFYYDVMGTEIEHMERIITELLVLTNPNKHKETEDIAEIMGNVVMKCQPAAGQKGVSLDLEVFDETYGFYCIKSQIEFVFSQLLHMLLKSIEPKGRITIDVNRTGLEEMTVFVGVEGLELTKDVLLRLGEPHYVIDEEGTGLEMMVVYKIIDDHHGTIQVDSNQREGTSIRITLPCVV